MISITQISNPLACWWSKKGVRSIYDIRKEIVDFASLGSYTEDAKEIIDADPTGFVFVREDNDFRYYRIDRTDAAGSDY